MPNQALKSASNQLVPAKQPVSVTELAVVPVVIENAGRKAKQKFVEFFTAEIENDNTRAAYAEAVDRFLYWCHTKKLSIETIEPTLVAMYFKQDCPETRSYKERSKPLLKAKSTKKQHLAAVNTVSPVERCVLRGLRCLPMRKVFLKMTLPLKNGQWSNERFPTTKGDHGIESG